MLCAAIDVRIGPRPPSTRLGSICLLWYWKAGLQDYTRLGEFARRVSFFSTFVRIADDTAEGAAVAQHAVSTVFGVPSKLGGAGLASRLEKASFLSI